MTTKINKRRILKMADFLENRVTDKHFDLNVILRGDNNEKYEKIHKNLNKLVENKTYRCNTAACSIGWMPAVFPRLCKWTGDNVILNPKVAGNDYTYNYNAAQKIFGLTEGQSEFLFSPEQNYMTRKQVIARIREFAESNGKSMEEFYG